MVVLITLSETNSVTEGGINVIMHANMSDDAKGNRAATSDHYNFPKLYLQIACFVHLKPKPIQFTQLKTKESCKSLQLRSWKQLFTNFSPQNYKNGYQNRYLLI